MRYILSSLAVAALAGGVQAQTQNLVFITNENTGTVIGPTAGSIGDGTDSANSRKVLVFDVDFDGDNDAFFLNWNNASRGLKNNGAGVFSADPQAADELYTLTSGRGAKGAAVFDADSDGDQDIFIANGPIGGTQQQNLFLANFAQGAPGTTNFIDVSASFPQANDDFDHSYDAAFLVVNGTRNTLIVANRSLDGVAGSGQNRIYFDAPGGAVLYNEQAGAASTNFNSTSNVRNSRDLVVADFDGDGKDDVFVANAGSASDVNEIFRQSGTSLVGDAVAAFAGDAGQSYGADAADLNGDGLPDLIVANRETATSGATNFFFQNTSIAGNVDFSAVAGSAFTAGSAASYDVTFGDLDGDGDQDIVVANNLNDNQVFMNDQVENGVPAANFFAQAAADMFTGIADGLIQSNGGRTRSIAIAEFGDYGPDANHQGAEVLFANSIAGSNEFYRGMGKQFFAIAGTATTTSNAVTLGGGGFMSPSIGGGGSLVVAGGNSAGVAVLDLALAASAVPFGTGTLVAQGGITTSQFALDGTGAATINVGTGDIPAALSGLQMFVQVRTDENGSIAGALDACSNGLSLVVQ